MRCAWPLAFGAWMDFPMAWIQSSSRLRLGGKLRWEPGLLGGGWTLVQHPGVGVVHVHGLAATPDATANPAAASVRVQAGRCRSGLGRDTWVEVIADRGDIREDIAL